MGYLGGPNFPQDPTDLGPLVPLPGGYQEVFQFLGECGYGGFEFFQLSQNAENAGGANPGTAAIRGWLDAAGIKSVGTHQGGLGMFTQGATPGTGTINATGQTRLAEAATLGHTMIGTAGDPSSANTVAAWQAVCANYSKMGELLLENYGIKAYLHPEQNNWNFFNDPAHPELSRKHRIDFFSENTDPRYVFFEPDVYHTYNARGRFPDPVDGSLWDAEKFIKSNWKRLVAWHIKDANRVVPTPTPPTSSYTQTRTRPGFPLNGGVDAIYALEGDLGKGFPSDPDPNSIGFRRFFTETRANRAKGFKYHIIESDSGPGGAPDPGRSLRLAKISARNLLGLA
jgi:hypothetical protein